MVQKPFFLLKNKLKRTPSKPGVQKYRRELNYSQGLESFVQKIKKELLREKNSFQKIVKQQIKNNLIIPRLWNKNNTVIEYKNNNKEVNKNEKINNNRAEKIENNINIINKYNLEKFFEKIKDNIKNNEEKKLNQPNEGIVKENNNTNVKNVNRDTIKLEGGIIDIYLSAKEDKEVVEGNNKPPNPKVDESDISNHTQNGCSSEIELNDVLNIINECEENNSKKQEDYECVIDRNAIDSTKINKKYILNKPIDLDDIGKNAVIDKLLLEIKEDNRNKDNENKKFEYELREVKGDGNCALSAVLKALEVNDEMINDNIFIQNFRQLVCDFLLNYEDQDKIDTDLNNYAKGNNFYERKINLANEMSKNYCYLNDIMIQMIAEMLNIIIIVKIKYYNNNRKNYTISFEYFGEKNNMWIDTIICLQLDKYKNDWSNHFRPMIFKIDNANNRKGRERVKERLINAIKHFKENNLDEVNKFLKVGLYNMGSILEKFIVKDSKNDNDCVYAALCMCLQMEALHAMEMRKMIAKIYMKLNRKNEAKDILYNKRNGNNEDINIICNEYNLRAKVYIVRAESYLKEENYGEKGPIIYMLLEKSKDDKEVNHVSALIPKKKERYENYKTFEKIASEVLNDIKILLDTKYEDICPENVMDINKKALKRSKTLKNIINENKSIEESDDELEINTKLKNGNESKKLRKVINREVTKELYNFIGKFYIMSPGSIMGKNFTKKVYSIRNKKDTCDDNILEEVKKFWNINIIENRIKEHLLNSKNNRGANMKINDKKYSNLYFEDKFKACDVFGKLYVSNDVGRRLGPCICTGCSKIVDKIPVFRILNDFICLRDHCSNMHKDEKGFGYIPKGSVVNLTYDKELYKIGSINQGSGKRHYLMNKEVVDKFNWEAGEKSKKEVENNNELKITGWNMMKAAAEDNVTLINKFLCEEKTDIFMINESGKLNNNKLNKDYKIYGNNKYVRTMISKKYDSTLCFPELNDDYCIICRITLETGSFIVFNYYLRPDDKKYIRIGDIKNKLRDIIAKSNNAKIVVYGDLNIGKEDIMKEIGYEMKELGGKVIFSDLENSFTRIRKVGEEVQISYIDYFINFGIKEKFFTVQKIGRSDHLAITMNIDTDTIDKSVCRKKELFYNYKKINENFEEISIKFIEAIKKEEKIENVVKLISELRENNKPRVRKVKNVFNLNEKLKNFINDKNILQSNDKNLYKELNKIARNIRKDEYCSFLLGLEKLKAKNAVKEFFVKMKFYTNINKKTDIIKNLIINENKKEGDLNYTTDMNIINKKITQKFKNLLLDDGKKRVYLPSMEEQNDLFNFSNEEIVRCIKKSNLNKATSWDMIPGKVFNKFINKKDTNDKEQKENVNNLRIFINDLVNNYIYLPEEISTARLVCINKDANKLGDVNNIRGIAVNSILIKLIERLLLNDLKKEIYKKNLIRKEQIGFMEGLGCEVNLLRMRQRCNDVKEINKGYGKAIIFIDLKNAYDTVAHEILFKKLENMKIRPRLIRILKALYSSARISLDIKDKSINVNRGVLQGSILSPFLFNLYINDLIAELKNVAFEVLAYADDIAIICSCEKEINLAINTVERWTKENKLLLNKKKSAIMYLFNSVIKWKKYLGFPVVKQYRYLGILINNWLNPIGGLKETSKKLEIYIRRNKWLLKRYFSIKTLIQLCEYFQKSRMTYGAAVFLQLNTIVDYIDEVCYRFMRNILGLGKGTPKSRFMVAIANGGFRNTMMIRLLKVIMKYRVHFNEHPKLYNNIINKFFEWYGKVDNNTNLNGVKKHTIIKSIKDMAKKNDISISEGYRKVVKKYWYRGSAEEEKCFIRYICETGWNNNHKKCFRCGSNEGYTKKHVLNECPVFEKWRSRTRKKIGCNNICHWLDNNIFKPKYKLMNDYKIKLIRSILNDFYKDKKKYMKDHKIRHAIIKYKRSKKGGKINLFDA